MATTKNRAISELEAWKKKYSVVPNTKTTNTQNAGTPAASANKAMQSTSGSKTASAKKIPSPPMKAPTALDEWKSQYNITKDDMSTGYNKWLQEAPAFVESVYKDTSARNGIYQNPEIVRKNRIDSKLSARSLQEQADTYRNYFTDNSSLYDETQIQEIMKALDGYGQYISDAKNVIDYDYNLRSRFARENAYTSYVEEQAKYDALPKEADWQRLASPTEAKRNENNLNVWKIGQKRGDDKYDFINNIDDYRETVRTASQMTQQQDEYGDYTRYNYISDEETAKYNYLYAKQGQQAAEEYLDYLEETLNSRWGAANAEGIDTNFERVMSAVPAGLDQFKSGVSQLFSKEALPTSATQFTSQEVRQDLDGGLGFVYDFVRTASNMAPSILLSTATGGIAAGLGAGTMAATAAPTIARVAGAGVMSLSAAGNAYTEKMKAGYDPGEAKTYAALVGASEGLLQYALGGISKLGSGVTGGMMAQRIAGIDSAFGRIAANLGYSMFKEGTEEGLQEVLEPIFSSLVFNEKYDPASLEEVTYSFLLGAASAGFFEGGEIVSTELNTQDTGAQFRALGDDVIQSIIDTGLESGQNTASYNIATQLQAKLDAGELITDYELGRLYGENVQTVSAEETTQQQSPSSYTDADWEAIISNTAVNTDTPISAVASPAPAPISTATPEITPEEAMSAFNGGGMSDAINAVPTVQTNARPLRPAVNQQTPDVSSEQTNIEAVADFAGTMGKAGSAAMTQLYSPTQNPADYVQAMTAYYNSGKASPTAEFTAKNPVAPLNLAQAEAAYLAGQTDAAKVTETVLQQDAKSGTMLAENISPEGAETIKEDKTNGKTEEGNDSGSRGGERTYGMVAAEPDTGISGWAKEAQAGAETQRRRAESLRTAVQAQGIVSQSTAEQGISSGTTNKTLRIVPPGLYTPEMQTVAQAQRAAGRSVTFFTGEMELNGTDGTFRARGAISADGKHIWVRADHDTLTVEQISKHEEFHALVKKDPELMRHTRDELVAERSEAEILELVNAYIDWYGWSDVSTDYVLEEVLADAYAGIDVFEELSSYEGATRFTETTQKQAKRDTGEAKPQEKFSMDKPVEETDRLIAWHNMSEDSLQSALELGGLAMPSFAIKPADMAHGDYGSCSVIAARESIDPQNSRDQKIFGGDAWTPTFPDVKYKASDKVIQRVKEKLDALVGDYKVRNQISRIGLDTDNVADTLSRNGGDIVKAFEKDEMLQFAFLKDTDHDAELPMKEDTIARNSGHDDEIIRRIVDEYGLDRLREIRYQGYTLYNEDEGIATHLLEIINGYYREKMDGYDRDLFKDLPFGDYDRLMSDAYQYARDGAKQTVDTSALRGILEADVDQTEYEAWLKELFDGIVERRGIRNNADIFTPSGNQRGWNALHSDYTLANIIKEMRKEAQQGVSQMFSGASSVKGAALKTYSNIENVRAERGRLRHTEAEAEAEYNKFSDRVTEIGQRMLEGTRSERIGLFEMGDALAETLGKTKTRDGIKRYMQREFGKFYNIYDGIENDVYELYEIANSIPMQYFESKLYRGMPLDEAAAIVVPDTTKPELIGALENAGANVLTYEAGNEDSRLQVVNSVEGARFSREVPVSQGISSAKTSIKQVPALFKDKNARFGETNIDIGGGRFDLATNYLADIGTQNMVFDPYNRGAEENTDTLSFLQSGKRADTSTVANVLNVIAEPTARANVILEAAKAINPDGSAYFMVYEGDGSGVGRETSAGWQNNRKTADYLSEIGEYFDSVQKKGKLIIATDTRKDLPKAAWEVSPGEAVLFSQEPPRKDSEGQALTKEQREYFKDSKVRDENGNLLVVYHGTTADFNKFSVGDVGYHLGTKEQAERRVHNSGKLMSLYANIRNPLEIEADYGNWGGSNLANIFLDNDYFEDPQVRKRLEEILLIDRAIKGMSASKRKDLAMRELLQSMGYDGIRYDNSFEGKGYSYIAFSSEQIKSTDNIAPTTDTDIRFSRESISDLREQNDALREKVDYWKGQTKLTKEPSLRQGDINKLAKTIIKSYESVVPVEDISTDLKDLGEFIVRGGDGADELTWTAVKDRAVAIARYIVKNAEVLVKDGENETFDAIKSYLRSNRLSFSNQGEITDFNDFRKRNFGRFTISKDGLPVDVAYMELTEMFGEGYFPSDIINPSEQLQHIADLFNSMRPIYENPHSMYMAHAIEYCSNEIIDGLIDESVRQTAPTFADKQAAKMVEQKAKSRRQLDALREQKNARIAELRTEGRERAKQALTKERERRLKQVSALKEHYRTKEARARDSRLAKSLRDKITAHANDLSAKLLRPTDKKHIPEALRGPVLTLLDAINLESSYEIEYGSDAKYHRVKPGESLYAETTKRTKAFAALKEAYKSAAGDLVVDPDLVGTESTNGLLDEVILLADVRIGEMNTNQLETVWQALRAIEASISTANKLFKAKRFETVSEVAEALRRDNAGKTAKKEYNKLLGKAQTLVELDMLTPEAFMHRLGESGDSIFRMMRDAQDEHIRIMKAAYDFTHDTIGKTNVGALEREMHTVIIGGETVKLSTAQLMELYVLNRREQALKHILTGGILPDPVSGIGLIKISRAAPVRKISMQEISDAVSLLTAEQALIAEKLQKYLSTEMSECGNKASMAVYNYRKFVEEYYWPIRSNRQEIQSDVQKDTATISIPQRGFTKATVPNADTSVRLGSIFDSFAAHVTEMGTYAAWLGTSEDINRIINYSFRDDEGNRTGTVKQIVETVHGVRKGTEYLLKLFSDISNGVKGTHAETDYMGGLTANYKAAAVGANLRVILQQPTAILRALDMVDAKYLAGSMAPLRGWEKAVRYAPIAQWKDWGYFDINTGRQMKDVLFDSDSVLVKAKQASMWLASKADSVAWGHLWNACEMETKDIRKDLKPGTDAFYRAVAERFAEIIDRTQVVDGILQRSQIMRSSSGLTKMATAFMGEPTKQYNMFVSAAYDAKHSKTGAGRTKAKGRMARTLMALLISGAVNAAVQSIVDAARDDDKEKSYWEKWLESFFGFAGDEEGFSEHFLAFWNGNLESIINPAQYIPFAKDIASIFKGYDVSRMDMESIEKTLSAVGYMIAALSGDGKLTVASASANLFAEVSRLWGLPVANIKRDLKSVVMTFATETDNYLMQYRMEKAMLNMNYAANSRVFLDILYQASLNDQEAYKLIYADLVKSGFDADKIVAGMESRMKKDQGVKSAGDLENRYLAPEQQTAYDRSASQVENSSVWKKADAEQQDDVMELLYGLTSGSNDVASRSAREKISEGTYVGLSQEEYLLYKLALSIADKPTESGNLGSYTNDETEAAIRMLEDMTDAKRDYLWEAQGKNENSTPIW